MTIEADSAPRLGLPWLPDEVAKLKLMRAAGMDLTSMAKALGRTGKGVSMKLQYLDSLKREARPIRASTFLELFGNCIPGIKPEGP